MTASTVETEMSALVSPALRVLANRADAVAVPGIARISVTVELDGIAAVVGWAVVFGLDEVPADRFNRMQGQVDLQIADVDHDGPLWKWCRLRYQLTDAEISALGLEFPVDSGRIIDRLSVPVETLRRVASC